MLNVFLFTGGYTGERVISLQTAATFEKHLDAKKYRVFTITVSRNDWKAAVDGKEVPLNFSNLTVEHEGHVYKADVALIALHGPPGENGWLQGLLEIHQIPYTTGDPLCMALSFDKKRSIIQARAHEIPTAKSLFFTKSVSRSSEEIVEELGLPLFVKPTNSGSSLGISKVKTIAELPKAITHAFSEGDEIMVESFLAGTEVTCGVYRKDGALLALPPTEIRSHTEFFDFQAKYHKASDEITPAEIPDAWTAEVQRLATKAYTCFDCKGVARADFMINPNGTPYFIEINTVPGMSAESIVPQQLAAANIALSEFLETLIAEALAR